MTAQTDDRQRKYPFTPKSNAKLRYGDYWPLRRKDGRFGFCVFLSPWEHLRMGIVIGLLEIVSSDSYLSPKGPSIRIVEAANTHVKTFVATSAQIAGNIADRLERSQVETFLAELQSISRVWGINVPLTRVNLVEKGNGHGQQDVAERQT